MFRNLLKFLNWIITGAFVLIISACYGAPGGNYYSIRIKTVDDNDNNIPFLKVSLYTEENFIKLTNSNSISNYVDNTNIISNTNINNQISAYRISYTDPNGEAIFGFFYDDYKKFYIRIEDIDSNENFGEFNLTNIEIHDENTNITVIMDKKK